MSGPQLVKVTQLLKGQKTTKTGLLAILGGAVGIFAQVWNLTHGSKNIDLTNVTTSIGLIGSGIGLVKAADSEQ